MPNPLDVGSPPPGSLLIDDRAAAALAGISRATWRRLLSAGKIGPAADPLAVVDSELRVHGLERLRVIDASVLPDMPTGNINAAVIMAAEKTADAIRGRALWDNRR